MVIVMQDHAANEAIDETVRRVKEMGYGVNVSRGEERTVIGVLGDERQIEWEHLELLPGVERVVRILKPYKLTSRDARPDSTVVRVGPVAIGGEAVVFIAGPCAVESREQIIETARAVKSAGAHMLRGGAYKPRSSPYSFQGMAEEGLKLLAEARDATGLPVVTEVMSLEQVETVARYADMLQIGARNMQNFPLLQEVGRSGHPVLLKRGISATIEEWLMAAEYLLASGNARVVLCERGIRTFETATRNTTDINAIPVVKRLSHLPVIVDPSHSTGKNEYIESVSRAAIAAGADGLIIEVHPHPDEALSDGAQSLRPEAFAGAVVNIKRVAAAVGRK
ncbi:MAG: 3-deoxy-7-phosphoheptulonate synthase [Anaerolineales bacterium]|nr:3-deoxy-7-phosphoheptulonate synthase [Anaerolineales bacterium]